MGKKDKSRKGPRGAKRSRQKQKSPEFYSVHGKMSVDEYLSMHRTFLQSELSKHGEMFLVHDKCEPEARVEVKVRQYAKFLLESSLNDGMLQEWAKYFSFDK